MGKKLVGKNLPLNKKCTNCNYILGNIDTKYNKLLCCIDDFMERIENREQGLRRNAESCFGNEDMLEQEKGLAYSITATEARYILEIFKGMTKNLTNN